MPKEKNVGLFKHLQKSSEARSIRAMIEMARSEPGMTRRATEFDADPMLLGVQNGVLDLRSASLLPVSPDILVTKRCNVTYDPTARCPLFMEFLKEIQPDPENRGFLKRFMGYCLTGSVGEGLFAFFYGHGANGKTVYIETFAWVLGDYARKIPTEMLMQHQRSPQGPSPDIVGLKGMRMIYANETEEGRRLDDARIKDMTGGDSLTGRVPYAKENVTFDPTFKLFIVGNHKPDVHDNSEGMWRRPVMVHFDQTIPPERRDRKLIEKLKLEGPGILNWALEGLREWQEKGLEVPQKIRAATAAYREEQDVLGEWMAECCKTGPGCSVSKSDLYFNYKSWCEENGHRPMAQTKLTRRLKERGFELDAGRRNMFGIELAVAASGRS